MLMGKDLVVRKEAENTGDEGILIVLGSWEAAKGSMRAQVRDELSQEEWTDIYSIVYV